MGAASFGSEYKSEITVKLIHGMQEKYPTINYMTEVRKKIESSHPGVEVKALNIGMIESEEAPIEIFLSSNDNELLIKEARRLKGFMDTIKGAKDAYISTDDVTPEIRIELDREKMGQLGLPIAMVGMQMQNALTGNDDVKYDDKGEEFGIKIMMDSYDRQNIGDIKSMSFVANDGKQVR
jgi:HAE1 family hydrophobic/amphiphilic exporter-1